MPDIKRVESLQRSFFRFLSIFVVTVIFFSIATGFVLRDSTVPPSGRFFIPQDVIDGYFKKFDNPVETKKESVKASPAPLISQTTAVIPLTDLFKDLLFQDTIDTKSDSIPFKDSLALADN